MPYSQRFTPVRNTTPRPTRRPLLSVTTTTEKFSPRPKNPLLFGCDFSRSSDKNCAVKFSGKDWQLFSSANERFYEIVLQNQERTEMFFSEMAPPPDSGIACLNFRYRKFLDSMNPLLLYSSKETYQLNYLCSFVSMGDGTARLRTARSAVPRHYPSKQKSANNSIDG